MKGSRKRVRLWLVRRDLRGKEVAAGAGVDASCVSHYLAGRINSPTIESWLHKKGCPARYLTSIDQEAA